MAKETKEESKGVGATYKYPRVNSLQAFSLPKSITAGCFNSRLSEIVVGLIYVPSTTTSIVLRDYSRMKLTKLLETFAE